MGAIENISHSLADTAAEALGLIDNPAFEVLLKTYERVMYTKKKKITKHL